MRTHLVVGGRVQQAVARMQRSDGACVHPHLVHKLARRNVELPQGAVPRGGVQQRAMHAHATHRVLVALELAQGAGRRRGPHAHRLPTPVTLRSTPERQKGHMDMITYMHAHAAQSSGETESKSSKQQKEKTTKTYAIVGTRKHD